MRALYVRLTDEEMERLRGMAVDERRTLHEQAAHLIGRGLDRWRLQQEFMASLPPMADDDPLPAGVA